MTETIKYLAQYVTPWGFSECRTHESADEAWDWANMRLEHCATQRVVPEPARFTGDTTGTYLVPARFEGKLLPGQFTQVSVRRLMR